MTESTDETPWAVVLRMRADGAPLEAIITALRGRGLPPEDIELLLKDSPEFSRSRARERPNAASATPPAEPEKPLFTTGPGSELRWFGVFVAVAVAMVGGGVVNAGEPLGSVALALGALVAGVLLASEFRVALRRTARRLGYVGFFVCVVPAVLGFISGWSPFHVVGVVGVVSSVAVLVWALTTGLRLRGVSEFGGGDVFEHNDVQFTVTTPRRPTLALGDAVQVVICAQNCVEAPRELVVQLGGEVEVVGGELRHQFPLEPGAVVEVTVPWRLRALATGWVRLMVGVSATGSARGARLRLDHGGEYVTADQALGENLLGVAKLAVLGEGSFRLGSNGNISVKFDADLPAVTTAWSPAVRTLWTPTAAERESAARL